MDINLRLLSPSVTPFSDPIETDILSINNNYITIEN